MSGIVTSEHVRRLFTLNRFPLPTHGLVFVGLRGILPVDPDDHGFKNRVALTLADVDYVHPRCTILQWLPKKGKLAAFPASTVPHRHYVQRAMARKGQGANQLMTGYYTDYRKVIHKAGSPTGHAAFRQVSARAIQRTADDFDYDTDDRVEFGNPFDNLHAGWSMGTAHDSFASAGCQVIVGYPHCQQRGDRPATGAWGIFYRNAYEDHAGQESFPYLLLNGRDVARLLATGGKNMTRVHFGSQAELVGNAPKETTTPPPRPA